PVLLERQTLPSGPPPWGDADVPWIDPDESDRVCTALFRKYFALIMQQRPGRYWRSQRAPVGWPVITKYVVPALYHYLRPYYPVRQYHHHFDEPSPGKYPRQLVEDMRDMLRLERLDLANDLTIERVTAAIQRHLKRAAPDRLMGRKMFEVPLPPREP